MYYMESLSLSSSGCVDFLDQLLQYGLNEELLKKAFHSLSKIMVAERNSYCWIL